MLVIRDASSILAVTENGYGKRSPVEEYPRRHRGGKGVIAIKANERNGNVVGVLQVNDEEDVMLITDGGKIIRMSMGDMRVIGRNTQGVRMINLNAGESVVDIDKLAEGYEEEGEQDQNGEPGDAE